jgi:hypothetical protein
MPLELGSISGYKKASLGEVASFIVLLETRLEIAIAVQVGDRDEEIMVRSHVYPNAPMCILSASCGTGLRFSDLSDRLNIEHIELLMRPDRSTGLTKTA